MYPTKSFANSGSGYSNSQGIFLNYARVDEVTKSKYNFSPRKQFCGAYIAGDGLGDYDDEYVESKRANYRTTTDGKNKLPPRSEAYMSMEQKIRLGRNYDQQACLMFMDTQRERNIQLGNRYKNRPMTEGECLINYEKAAAIGVKQGSTAWLNVNMFENLVMLAIEYNKWQKTKSLQIDITKLRADYSALQVEMPCTVAFIGDGSYGKFPRESAPNQVIMEYGPSMRHLANYLPPTLHAKTEFRNWMLESGAPQSDPKKELQTNKLYSMSDFVMVTLPDPRVKYY